MVGRALFSHDPLVYLSIFTAFVIWWFLTKSRTGLILRAVGENHTSAHALGFQSGGSLFSDHLWWCTGWNWRFISNPRSDSFIRRGDDSGTWLIALALVVFASWRPFESSREPIYLKRLDNQLHGQALGVSIASQWLSMLPYVVTIGAWW